MAGVLAILESSLIELQSAANELVRSLILCHVNCAHIESSLGNSLESSVNELESSVIELESSVIKLVSSVFQLKSSLIQYVSSLIQ